MQRHSNPIGQCIVGSLLGLLACSGCAPLAPADLSELAEPGGSLPLTTEAVGVADSPDADLNAVDPATARRRDAVTTNIDYGYPFADGVWHLTFVASPIDANTWDVRAGFDPDGIGYHSCAEPCPGTPCQFWDMRGTARARVTVGTDVATEVAADGCYRRDDCGGRTPVTVYCTFTIDAAGVATVSDFLVP